ncbi:MAG: hypothetical protein IJE60_09355, partial [Tyzzerella sp.]|nr:hypothetical protein [Tyzzerella sp.]
TAKSEISTWRENSFLGVYGGQGAKPIASKNSRLSTWKKGGILSVVYIHNQCLLCLSRIIENHSYTDFFIIPTIIGKADKHAVFLDKGRDNFCLSV